MTKQIIHINSSLIRNWTCLRHVYLMSIKGYAAKANSIDIEFGSAVHAFIKTLKLNGGNVKDAVKTATDYFANTPHICRSDKRWMEDPNKLKTVCMDWYSHWDTVGDDLVTLVASDSKPMVEVTFAIPYYVDDMFEVILSGTWDDISRKGQNGLYILRDYKTTSTWKTETYLKDYSLSPQLHFYSLCLSLYGVMYPDSIFGEILRVGFGMQIEGIFLKSSASSTIERSDVFRFGPQRMAVFKLILDGQIKRLLSWIRQHPDTKPMPEGMFNGACEGKYGPCEYACLCNALDDVAAGFILTNNFTIKPYNPLTIH